MRHGHLVELPRGKKGEGAHFRDFGNVEFRFGFVTHGGSDQSQNGARARSIEFIATCRKHDGTFCRSGKFRLHDSKRRSSKLWLQALFCERDGQAKNKCWGQSGVPDSEASGQRG